MKKDYREHFKKGGADDYSEIKGRAGKNPKSLSDYLDSQDRGMGNHKPRPMSVRQVQEGS